MKKAPARKNKFFVYIVECRDGTYYTGYTPDLKNRLKAHNSGKGAKYTRTRRPVRLVYCETFETKSKALKREMGVKGYARADKLHLIKHGLGQRPSLEKLRNL